MAAPASGFSRFFLQKWRKFPQFSLGQTNIAEALTMGRLSRSWDLVSDSFRVLWADKHLLMFPVLSGISCVIVTFLLLAGSMAILQPQLGDLSAWFPRDNPEAAVRSPELMAAIFALYLA